MTAWPLNVAFHDTGLLFQLPAGNYHSFPHHFLIELLGTRVHFLRKSTASFQFIYKLVVLLISLPELLPELSRLTACRNIKAA